MIFHKNCINLNYFYIKPYLQYGFIVNLWEFVGFCGDFSGAVKEDYVSFNYYVKFSFILKKNCVYFIYYYYYENLIIILKEDCVNYIYHYYYENLIVIIILNKNYISFIYYYYYYY